MVKNEPLSPAYDLVTLRGKVIGETLRTNDGFFHATFFRWKAESHKKLGVFSSRRAATRAVQNAVSERVTNRKS